MRRCTKAASAVALQGLSDGADVKRVDRRETLVDTPVRPTEQRATRVASLGDALAAEVHPTGAALAAAVLRLRQELSDPLAPIAVIVTAGPNGVLARRALTAHGPLLRVWFETPETLLQAQTPLSFWMGDGDEERALRPEPAGWLRVTLAAVLQDLARGGQLGRFADALVRPGWRNPLASAVTRLEAEGVTSADLDAIVADPAASALKDRAQVLSHVLRALELARHKEKIASQAALLAAATAALAPGAPPGIGAATATGVVVVGDKGLPFQLFQFLRRWLGARAVIRLVLPGAQHLSPALCGLAAAATDAPTLSVDTQGLPLRLQTLTHRLFATAPESPPVAATTTTATATAPPEDTSVVFVRTPDDVRECVECVREVQRAIVAGTPLDRIAVVLPDGQQRGALEEALDRAEIPRTWFVGFPARELVSARLLRIAVDIGCGDESVERLYEILSHPALQLRAVLGPDGVKGRGRWRRLLAQLNGAQGLTRIIAALQKQLLDTPATLPASEAGGPSAAKPGTAATDAVAKTVPDENPAYAALRSLVASTQALHDALAPLRERGALGAHARAWRDFAEKLIRRSEPRGRLVALLEPMALSTGGPLLSPTEARDELHSLLDREIPRGTLTERSLAVLPPLHLAGSDFDVICVLGLTEGRFPSVSREDAVLPDALLEALGTRLARRFSGASSHQDLEKRRFAAVVGAARKRLWLSSPVLDFETERPTLPSTLVLAALSTVLGRRARFSDLVPHSQRAGSRARAFPTSPDDALGSAEHLLSRTAENPASTLGALLTHPTSRGLLQLHRSMDRLRFGPPGLSALDAWTGKVPLTVLAVPGLDGAPVDLRILEDVIRSPADVFFRQMLQAFPPASLRPRRAPLEKEALEEILARVANDETFVVDDLVTALAARAVERLSRGVELGAFRDDDLLASQRLIEAIALVLEEDAADYCKAQTMGAANETGTLIAKELPWRVRSLRGRLVAGAAKDGNGDNDTGPTAAAALVDVTKDLGRKTKLEADHLALSLSALALLTQGVDVDRIQVVTPSGGSGEAPIDKVQATTMPRLLVATKRVLLGLHPMYAHPVFGLVGDAVPGTSGDGADDAEVQS